MLDFEPATDELTRIINGVGDDQLGNETPCSQARVGDLLDHLDTFAQAFTASATKTKRADERPRPADGSQLGPDWRTRVPHRLDRLASAWRDPSAWEGMSVAGPFEMPAPDVARVAIDELVVHGWDIAVATGQAFRGDDALVAAALEFVESVAKQSPEGTPGLFGPPVPVPDTATSLERLLGLTGRDASWAAVNG